MWAGLEDVPEGAAFRVVHDEVEVREGLEGADEVGGPGSSRQARAYEKVAFELGEALLGYG